MLFPRMPSGPCLAAGFLLQENTRCEEVSSNSPRISQEASVPYQTTWGRPSAISRRRAWPDATKAIPLLIERLSYNSFLPFMTPSRLPNPSRSEEHTSELQSLMRISYAVFCLKQKIQRKHQNNENQTLT